MKTKKSVMKVEYFQFLLAIPNRFCDIDRLKEQQTLLRQVNATDAPTDNKQQIPTDCTQGPLLIALITTLILLVLVLVAILFHFIRKYRRKGK